MCDVAVAYNVGRCSEVVPRRQRAGGLCGVDATKHQFDARRTPLRMFTQACAESNGE